jgi:hypothetical protein
MIEPLQDSKQLMKNNLMELAKNNVNLDESLCLEDWYFKSDSKLREKRLGRISKKNLMKLSRAPFKYTLKNFHKSTATANWVKSKKNKKELFKLKKSPAKFNKNYKKNKRNKKIRKKCSTIKH